MMVQAQPDKHYQVCRISFPSPFWASMCREFEGDAVCETLNV